MSAHRLLSVIVCALLLFTSSRGGLIPTLSGWNGAQGQQERRALGPGTPADRVIADGETHAYSLRLNAGELVHVFIYQRGVNIAAKLVGPDGKTLLDADSPNSTQEAEWITHVATESGDYGIEIALARKGGLPGRYEIAMEERRKATPRDESRLSAQRAFADGTRLFGEEDYTGAAGKYQEAVALYRQSGRRLEEAVALNCIARSYVSLNDNRTAIERFKEALSIYRETGDVQGLGFTEHEIGMAYFNSSGYDDARSHFEQALDARRKAGYRAGEAMTVRALGAVYSSIGQQEKAIEYFEQAVTISRAEHVRSEEARTLANLGIANSLLGRPDKAIEYLEAALAISREIHDRTIEGSTLGALGNVSRSLSRYEESIGYTEQLLAISRETKDRAGQALALNNIGNTYVQMARYEKSLEFLEPALAISREAKLRNLEGFVLSNLGNTYFWLSAYDKAIDYGKQALVIFREIKNRGEEGRTLNNLGDAYNVQGRYDKSVDYYEQSLVIARAVKNPVREARALGSLGIAYTALGRSDSAIASYEQALVLFRQVKDLADEGATLVSLGEAHHAAGRYGQAIDYYQQALPITRTVKNRTGEGLTLADLMLAVKQQGSGGLAILYGKQAVNAFQEVRGNLKALDSAFQESYLKSHEDAYRSLADLLISQARLSEAERVLELLKEEEFNRIRRNGPDKPTIGLTSTEAEAAKISDQLASLAVERGPLLAKIAGNTATDRDRQRLDVIETAITEANKQIKLVLADVATGSPDERLVTQQSQSMMQSLRRLGNGTVALYTVITNDKGWVILTTPDFRRAYPVRSTDLNKAISEFRLALTSDRYDPVTPAQRLYDALFLQKNDRGLTLAADLKAYGARTLMWSLDGVLRYVPIGALHDGKEYLVERYPNVVFTTASLTRLLDPTQATWRAFGLGVSKEYEGFPALPSVPRELHSIIRDDVSSGPRGVLPGVIRLDEQFTRKAMIDGLREGYPVVHIASHFSFNPAKEETSFLLLGDGSYLSLEEMQNSPGIFERVELLTLSACDTATTGANGKEVEGMAFVAQDLGAKAVVASLWPVADIGTEVLMREFYRLRQANPRWSKGEALRQAQLALLKGKQSSSEAASGDTDKPTSTNGNGGMKLYKPDDKARFAHPHYWAPFILIGNWK